MPPPPSQKGKFKPRKPSKKIRPGAATVPSESTATAGIPAAVPSDRGDRSSGRGDKDGRGRGRGRGRGGRGGRGRGPRPQGRVFFVAAPKPATASSRKKSAVGSKIMKQQNDQSEEVVGQLDSAIGSSAGKRSDDGEKQNILDSMDYDNYDDDTEPQGGRGRAGGFSVEAFTYDSDSSREEERSRRRHKESTIPPMELPFPPAKLPVGAGASERPIMYECQGKTNKEQAGSNTLLESQRNPEGLGGASPFVGLEQKNGLKLEQDSWFLVQFPTRLPPLQQNISDAPQTDADGEAKEETTGTAEGIPMPTIADVATPPIVANSFDNSLSNATPGRLGKLVVYKSGKTVLVLEGPEGSTKIRMNVTEGLSCGFLQQAVAIDIDQGKYVALGNVGKSIVVSPDLENECLVD